MTGRNSRIAGALLALTLLGFFGVPGHTFLQSDTQIYIPIFERLENPDLYQGDFLMTASHVSLTVYDETALALRRLTHATFQSVLAAEQILFRALALWGVFLIATALGLSDAAALLLAACYGIGATIVGPAVLSVEYEPVPRGFAVAFLLLATGLLMQGRYTWACAAASLGVLYHVPSTGPFWILFGMIVIRERRWRSLWPAAPALICLAATFLVQRNQMRPQPFFTLVDPEWEQIIHMRAAYDWISNWPAGSILAFLFCAALSLAALWRIRDQTNLTQRILLAGFPLIGLASIALSWLLLDLGRWALIAQVQPARAALFTIVFAQINCGLAALFALKNTRWAEAFAWFIPVFLPATMPLFFHGTSAQLLVAGLLAMLATLAIVKARWLAAPAIALAATWAIPALAHTINYQPLHTPELDQLSEWARTSTSEHALFVFPVSGRNLDQGVFRAKSLRGLYADWKAGGQVNYFRDFALEWHKRWQELSSGTLTPDDWRACGVNYLIYAGPECPVGQASACAELQLRQNTKPVFENARYRAYQLANRNAQ